MDEQFFRVILLIISIIGAIITSLIIPYIKSKISNAQFEMITKWVNKTVDAAEVLFDLPKSGQQKREYVINKINKIINSKRTIVTEDQIRILIEAAVKSMKDNNPCKKEGET